MSAINKPRLYRAIDQAWETTRAAERARKEAERVRAVESAAATTTVNDEELLPLPPEDVEIIHLDTGSTIPRVLFKLKGVSDGTTMERLKLTIMKWREETTLREGIERPYDVTVETTTPAAPPKPSDEDLSFGPEPLPEE